MNLKYFPHFIKANFPDISSESNESLMELGEEFKKYLLTVFKDDLDKLQPIWNIDIDVAFKKYIEGDVFTQNGYHSALILHFMDFIKNSLETDN